MTTEKNITQLTLILSIILFIASLTQTAYCTNGCVSSFIAFLFGFFGLSIEFISLVNFLVDRLSGGQASSISNIGATFVWLANPIILFSLFVIRHSKKMTLILSIISTLLILSFMKFDKVINDEAGHYSKVTELKLGYWLWLLSSLTILIGSITIKKLPVNKREAL